jgi:ActR/RegA family two-component response regulator
MTIMANQQEIQQGGEVGSIPAVATAELSPWQHQSVLVVDDEPGMVSFLHRSLALRCGWVATAGSVEDAAELLNRRHFDLIVLDIALPGRSGVEWLHQLREQGFAGDVVLMTAYADLETAIDALRAGASDFLLKPFSVAQMLNAVKRCFERSSLRRENFVLRRELDQRDGSVEGMIGKSCADPRSLRAHQAHRADAVDGADPWRIRYRQGTRGTRPAPHEPARQRERCGALRADQLRRDRRRPDRVRTVRPRQGRLHRRRQRVARACSTTPTAAPFSSTRYPNCRCRCRPNCCACWKNARCVRWDRNRKCRSTCAWWPPPTATWSPRSPPDAFAATSITGCRWSKCVMPPLRDRIEDLPDLVHYFIGQLSARLGLSEFAARRGGSDDAWRATRWPGNVRELKNLIERSLILGFFADDFSLDEEGIAVSPAPTFDSATVAKHGEESLAAIERRHILGVLDGCKGNKSEAARRLGVSRKTLERKCAAWGV